MPKYQYKKQNMSKHERDRLIREAIYMEIEKTIREEAWQVYRLMEPNPLRARVRESLGNGCYWRNSLKGAE